MAFFKLLRKSPIIARIGMVMILLNIAAAILAPVIAPYGETEVVGDVWMPMSGEHFLGTDHIGRDLFTRLLYGARNTIAIAFVITMFSFAVGISCGFFAATLGGWTDLILSRLVDTLMAIPVLIFALVLLAVVGNSIPKLIVVIALLDATRVYRLSRAVAMDIEIMEYVEAARALGANDTRILVKHLFPNILGPLIVAETMAIPVYIFLEAFLSFIGLGVNPPTPSWGIMISEGIDGLRSYPNQVLIPAIALSLTTLAFNFMGDGLRDAFDPRQKDV